MVDYFENLDYFDRIKAEEIENHIKMLELMEIAETDEEKKVAERFRKDFYLDIESVKIKDIEKFIKLAEEAGDNEKKALLERFREEVQNARREMYKRKAPKIVTDTLGLNHSGFRHNEYEYWAEAEIEDLVFSEQAIDEIKISKNNFEGIEYGTNTRAIEAAIERAEETGDNEKKEKLISIRDKIERVRASATIYGYRYQPGKENSVERKPDERILGMIDRMFEELEQEASAGFVLNSEIYVYLTNAKDKNDLLKRLEVVNSKLEEYEKVKSTGTISYIKDGTEKAIEDFESGDILGIDKEVEER